MVFLELFNSDLHGQKITQFYKTEGSLRITSLLVHPVLHQFTKFHAFTTGFSKVHLNTILPHTFIFSKGSLPEGL
jgi:hypothetical protein